MKHMWLCCVRMWWSALKFNEENRPSERIQAFVLAFFLHIFFLIFSLEMFLYVQTHLCAHGHSVVFNAFDSNWLQYSYVCDVCVCALCIKWSTNTHLNHNRWNEEGKRCSPCTLDSYFIKCFYFVELKLWIGRWFGIFWSFRTMLGCSCLEIACLVMAFEMPTNPYSSIHFSSKWTRI